LIFLILILFSVLIIHIQEITAQYVINNEVLSKSDNDDDVSADNDIDNSSNSKLNEFAPKPLVHVSIQGTEINDKIRGGNGDDFISGEDGDDILQGNEGDDELDGGDGDDELDGGQGKDSLDGGDDNDEIRGGDGDDELDGGDGDDELDGGDGDDELKGGKGADLLVCDKDDKIIDYNSLENDIIQGYCKYEDKGLIPEPISKNEKNLKNIETNPPLFPNSFLSSNNDHSNTISELFGIDDNRIFR
jgi:Ca2+-binding RTX toxin-like protein